MLSTIPFCLQFTESDPVYVCVFAYAPVTMEDRESIYLDTISVASEFPNRKSMSLSRQTIYHSAEDMHDMGSADNNGVNLAYNVHKKSIPDFQSPNKFKRFNHTEMQMLAGADEAGNGCGVRDFSSGTNDEVSARLLFYNNKTVTYSQWKSRVTPYFL